MPTSDDLDTRDWNRIAAIYRGWADAGAAGAPVLGTWQQVFHLECDVRPRQREIVVTVRGD